MSALLDYDSHLDAEQRAVVFAGAGPILVLAGAGSGKTRTLVWRVARLIELGVRPHAILLLTFTNKAANEMMQRARELLGDRAQGLRGGTFHAVGLELLREFDEAAGVPAGFAIIDRDDALKLLGQVFDAHPAGRDPDLRSALPTPRELLQLRSLRQPPPTRHAQDILAQYTARKYELNVLDYDDLLEGWARLMLDEQVASVISARFEHVLVDEYQDTNPLQAAIVERCIQVHGNITAVGDDCQSIYGFRGADIGNILHFRQRHPAAHIFLLRSNYRSSPQIVGLANHAVSFNRMRFDKELMARSEAGSLPNLVICRDAEQQASHISTRIRELCREGRSPNDIAILYRAHFHALELEIELARLGVPFHMRSGRRFFQRPHVKDVLAYVRAAYNPRDAISMRRVVELIRGIGPKTADGILARVQTLADLSAPAVLKNVPGRSQDIFQERATLLLQISEMPSVAARVETVLDSAYIERLELRGEDSERALSDLQQLQRLASLFPDTAAFLEAIVLASELPAERIEAEAEDDPRVTLTTIHQAKGLEWPVVFVIGLNQGRFPSEHAAQPHELEEERRLFYVACTRARTDLTLTCPLSARDREGRIFALEPSVFVRETLGLQGGVEAIRL